MTEFIKQGHNCWRKERADHVSILVDYGNYYRDLRQSIIRAQKSIFLLGWDIDSRIELLRGKDAEKNPHPTVFFDLICWKASENPDLQIYLNRWDYSMFFMRQREPLWEHKWQQCGHPNIHVVMDDVLPLSACHHQKIAIIDDEIAYWGGMDIALGRWDFRQHHVKNKNRADPAQLPSFDEKEAFDPYHDIQAVMSGPAARALAEWARVRWKAAAPKITPVPLAPPLESGALPATWPRIDPPDFTGIDVAIARTMPAMSGQRQVEEIYHLLLEEIAQAENFIYIENQFLACADIAHALNKRLHEKPDLRVLAVSCHNPNGIMERLAMWGGRVKFRDIIEAGGVADRVALTYPLCREEGREATVRIHSKLMIIDDRYLHIGSANINRRSMGMDTECDVLLCGEDDAARTKIASVRNDLIREHTGYEEDYIADVVNDGKHVAKLVDECPGSRQHLRLINDEAYRDQPMADLAYKLADPRRPLISSRFTRLPRWKGASSWSGRQIGVVAAMIALIAALSILWSFTPLAEYNDPDKIEGLFEQVRNAPFALLWLTLIYVVGGLLFFPVTALSTAVILIFGGVKGFIYATIGALASGLVGYGLGKLIGRRRLLSVFPKAEKAMDKIKGSGVIGVTVIRMVPIAPFSVVNMAMGVIHVPIFAYLLGTALGLSPGKVMLAIFGQSFIDVFKNPDLHNILIAGAGIIAWIGVVWMCNKLARQWQARHEQAA